MFKKIGSPSPRRLRRLADVESLEDRVLLAANLRGTNFDVVQEPLGPGQSFDVNFTVENNGTSSAAGFVVDFYVSTNNVISTSDRLIGAANVPPLVSGGTHSATAPSVLPSVGDFWIDLTDRDYYIGMIVDASGAVAESDEGDNSNRGEFLDWDTVLINQDDLYEQNDVWGTSIVPPGRTAANWEGQPLSTIAGLGITRDDDWYKIETTPIGFERIVIDVTFTHADGDIDIELYNSFSSYPPIASAKSSTDNEHLDFQVRAPGEYYIRVYGFGGAVNTYDLVWDDLPATGQPNLLGTSFDVNSPLTPGQSHFFNYQILNSGNAAANIHDVEIYISTNNIISSADYLLDTQQSPVLWSNGGNLSAIVRGTMPPVGDPFWVDLTDRDYYVGMIIDSGNVVAESDETDNSNRGEGLDWDTVRIVQEDLYEENDTAATAIVPPGQTAADWENIPLSSIAGLGITRDDDWYVIETDPIGFERIVVDATFTHADGDIDIELYDSTGTNLLARSTSTSDNEHIDFTAPLPGTYLIRVYGYNGAVNTYDLIWDDLPVTGQPNLLGTHFGVSLGPFTPGESFGLTYEIQNIGNVASNIHDVNFYLSTDNIISSADLLLGTDPIPILAANGGTFTVASALRLPTVGDPLWIDLTDRDYYIGMIVDAGNAVAESNESDNSNRGQLLDWDALRVNQEDLYEENDTAATAIVPPGHTAADWAGSPLSSIAGLGITRDDDWYKIEVPAASERLFIDATFTHAAGNVEMSLHDGSSALLASALSTTDNEHIDYIVPGPGTYFIRVWGHNGAVNTYDLQWIATAPPNLVPTVVDFDPGGDDILPPGGVAAVDFTILNSGGSVAQASQYDVGVYLSSDATIDPSTDTLLAIDQGQDLNGAASYSATASVIIPVGTTPGTYYIGVYADDGLTLIETDEADNALAESIQVTISRADDLLTFDPASGRWYRGVSNGAQAAFASVGRWSTTAGWSFYEGDFDGDGTQDVAGLTATGQWWVGRNHSGGMDTTYFGRWGAPSTYQFIGVGDFNRDDRTDIVGFDLAGQWWIGTSDGTSFTTQYTGRSNATGWTDFVVGDFDGNGKDDIGGFRESAAGEWWIRYSTGLGRTVSFTTLYEGRWSPTADWGDFMVADITGDGREDIVAKNATGQWWRMAQPGVIGSRFDNQFLATWGAGYRNIATGDINGDGFADIIGLDSASQWWIVDGQLEQNQFIGRWSSSINWISIIGDFNGDGRDGVAGYDPVTGQWWLGTLGATRLTTSLFGTTGQRGIFDFGFSATAGVTA